MAVAITERGILAGYDGSARSGRALSWAAREAAARGESLAVCYAPQTGPASDAVGKVLAHRGGEQILAKGVRLAQDAGPGVKVEALLAAGPAAAALCEHSGRADMVVVGSHGQGGGVPGTLLGSVSSQVAEYAERRVVVEHGRWRAVGQYAPGPVVVGADGSIVSQAALRFAVEEAALRAAPLMVVCALADCPARLGNEQQVQENVEGLLDRLEKEYPEVTVLRQITAGGPLNGLLAAAHDAQMVVVGARGLGGVRGMRLGSTARGVLHHSPCPVGIVHH
jgi:nucleotide-binding universal stress UspA family protein